MSHDPVKVQNSVALACLLVIVCVVAAASALPVLQYHEVEATEPAHYEFSYSVQDAHSGDVKQQHEARAGDAVQGSYSLVQPDGVQRIVHYTADKEHGFNADVSYEGHPTEAPAKIAYAAVPVQKYAYAATPVQKYAYAAAPVQKYAYAAAPVQKYTYAAAPEQKYAYAAAPVHNYAYAAAPVQKYTYAAAPVAKLAYSAEPLAHVTFASPAISYHH